MAHLKGTGLQACTGPAHKSEGIEESDLYCCEPRDVNGVKPTMKKCRRGNGIRLTASFLKSEFSCPGKRRQHVIPDITAEIRWFKSPKVGVVSFSVRKQMSYSASLSKIMHSSAFSTSWWTDSVALYGSTTVSETFGDGTTENVSIIRSATKTSNSVANVVMKLSKLY